MTLNIKNSFLIILTLVILVLTLFYLKKDDAVELNLHEDVISKNGRALVLAQKPQDKYQEIVYLFYAPEVTGDYDSIKAIKEDYEKKDYISSIEAYNEGYGAKRFVIGYSKTYDTIEALMLDETNSALVNELQQIVASYESTKIVFVLTDMTYTDKSEEEGRIHRLSTRGQYFVVSEVGEKLNIVYSEFLGN